MLPSANKAVGLNLGFPDVCLTPTPVGPIPIPYPNLAMNAQAVGFSVRVRLSGANALNLSSRISMTSGDEGGSAHPMFKQAGAYTMGNPKVFIESLPGICLLCPTTGNNMNNPIGAVLVPSITNVFFTYAHSVPASELTLENLEELSRAITSVGADKPPVDSYLDPNGTAKLRIRIFSADVPARVFCALREFEAQGMTSLVFDLRGCPGGDLMAAVELAGDFLPPNSIVTTVIDADGDETILRAGTEKPFCAPIVLLVDTNTASAAEIFAHCLVAHGRATLEGGPMYGKTSAQILVPGPDGSPIRATIADTRTPYTSA